MAPSAFLAIGCRGTRGQNCGDLVLRHHDTALEHAGLSSAHHLLTRQIFWTCHGHPSTTRPSSWPRGLTTHRPTRAAHVSRVHGSTSSFLGKLGPNTASTAQSTTAHLTTSSLIDPEGKIAGSEHSMTRCISDISVKVAVPQPKPRPTGPGAAESTGDMRRSWRSEL